MPAESTDSDEEHQDPTADSSSGPQLRAEEGEPLVTQTQVDIFRYYAQHTDKTPEQVANILEKYAGSLPGLLAALSRRYGGLRDHEVIRDQLAQQRAAEADASRKDAHSSSWTGWSS